MKKSFAKIWLSVAAVVLTFCFASTAFAADRVEHVHDYKTVITKEATCSENGLKVTRCDCGAESYAIEIPAKGHNSETLKNNKCTHCGAYYIESGKTIDVQLESAGMYLAVAWSSTENAKVENYFSIPLVSHTATVRGVRAGTATLYAYSRNETIQTSKIIIECKTHTFNEYTSDGNASCVDGTKTAVCQYCDATDTVTDVGSAVHTYIYKSNGNAGCETNGTQTGVCTKCNKVVISEEPNSALGHSYGYYKPNNDATCEKNGTRTAVCERCKKENTVEAEGTALGHNFSNYIYNNDTTCKKDGTKTSSCTRCDAKDTITVEGSATGHSYVIQQEVKPTCKKDGLTRGSYCGFCGEVFIKQEVIPATGEHEIKFSTSEASFDLSGTYIEFCRLCDDNYVVHDIPRVSKVSLEATSYNYDGKEKTPKVTLADSKGTELIEGSDYELQYDEGRTLPGKYGVKIVLKGSYKGEKTLYFYIRPTKTAEITATQKTTSITLKWSAVTGATGYRIYVYDTNEQIYTTVKTTSKTSYTIKNLEPGTTYKYRIKAYVKVGTDNLWSKQTEEITTSTKPETLTVKVKAGTKKAVLSWDKVQGAKGYQVYMKAPGESYKRIKVTSDDSYTKTGLKSGKTYKFRVRAYRKVDGKYIYGSYKTYSVKVK